MRYVTCTVAIAALAGAVAGCADASYPGYGYRQPYSSSGYNYYPAPGELAPVFGPPELGKSRIIG